MEEFNFGFVLGILFASVIAFCERDSANIHEYKYGEHICQKNGGFQYFEKRMFADYTFFCKDKASFTADENNIEKIIGAWTDKTIVEEKK